MTKLDDLWRVANAAFIAARALPPGPKRIEALKEAGLLRNEAARQEIDLKEEEPSARKKPTNGVNSNGTL
jgi:hypothetical protein